MKFRFVFSDTPAEWNVSCWRSLIPSDAINKYGGGEHSGRLINISDFAQYGHPVVQEILSDADVVIVQRNLLIPEIWEACDYWRSLGKIVVGDLDDDYPRLTPQNPAYMFWIGGKATEFEEEYGKTPIEALTEGLRHVDALMSPNQLILNDWNEMIGISGYILRNYAKGEWYEDIEQKPLPAPDEPIIVGWGGSVSHYDSWVFSGALDAMLDVFEADSRVKARICGNDFRLLSLLDEKWPEGRWEHQEGVPPDKWPGIVASFDVGLAPLCGPAAPQSELYDQHRSSLKAVEYALCGVPWLATPGVVYDELDGRGGYCLEKNDREHWRDGILDVVQNLDRHKTASRELMPWAFENWTMQHNVQTYVDLFTRVAAESQARRGIRLADVFYVADLMAESSADTTREVADVPAA